MVKN
jgi:hypothetical protein